MIIFMIISQIIITFLQQSLTSAKPLEYSRLVSRKLDFYP